MTEIFLPQLGDLAAEATIERYYKQVGDSVEPGDPLVVVRTRRFEWDVPATAAGTIGDIVAQPGATIPVGAALVRLDGAAAEAEEIAVEASADSRATRATPVARKIATVHGLDLSALRGSGPRGIIRRVDVLAVVGEPAVKTEKAFDSCFALNIPTEATITAPRPAETQPDATAAPPANRPAAPQQLPLSAAQRSIAAQLIESKLAIPHALTAIEVELSAVLAYVEAQRGRLAKRGIDLSVTTCIAQAAVAALTKHRLLNSVWSDDGIIVRGQVQLGVAAGQQADSAFGLIPDAADLSLQGLARALSRRQSLEHAAELAHQATFTLCDEGGTRWRHAIIPAVQGAILTIGAIERRPYVLEQPANDTIVIRPLTILTLAYDARCISPPQADEFLTDLRSRLEHFSPL
ncbi:MAG TPA: 2-oxo acid dehydrogenase subunit E2 [Herpetosiphonaceae bacterium]